MTPDRRRPPRPRETATALVLAAVGIAIAAVNRDQSTVLSVAGLLLALFGLGALVFEWRRGSR